MIDDRFSHDDPDSLVLQGLRAHQDGWLDQAAACYDKALARKPGHADALNLSGVLAFSTGRIDHAIKLIGKAIQMKPDHLDAHLNLAEALEFAGRRRDALATCHKALLVAPDFAEGHGRLALLYGSSRDIRLALAHARIALALDPDLVEAYCGQALALFAQKNYEEADRAYGQALKCAPENLRAITGRAALFREMNRIHESTCLYRKALDLRPDDARILASLATLSEAAGRVDAAREFFERSLGIDPTSVDIRYSFGRFLRDVGEFDEATRQFNVILQSNPAHAPSLAALVRMKRLPDSLRQRKILSRIITNGTEDFDHRVRAGFALGEMLERAGEYDAAFEQFLKANTLQAKALEQIGERFDRTELQQLSDAIEAGLGGEYAALGARWGNPTEAPVFIVGLPRSGTSLVEQICSSHPQVAGLGELRAIGAISQMLSIKNRKVARIADWDAATARAQADAHAAELAARSGTALRAIDKNPHNLLNLGVISALYPNARVIRCLRDPRDVAISNYTLYFNRGNPYSNRLEDCGYAIKTINKIGDLWSKYLNIRILDVQYEKLIENLEAESKRIIQFLDLDWDNACLDYHATDRHVGTPSSWQVRQPVYRTSVARWSKFSKHLGPLLKELDVAS